MRKNPLFMMKKVLSLVLLALIFIGCKKEEKEVEPVYAKVEDDFILVEGGSFTMGDNFPSKAGRYARPPHTTSVDSFYISAREVSKSEYNLLMESTKDESPDDDKLPAKNLSWYEAIVFCNKLSMRVGAEPAYYMSIEGKDEGDPDKWGKVPVEKNSAWDSIKWKKDANGYRLPTEAEWEFAARGGLKSGGFSSAGTDFDSPTLREYAWFMLNSGFEIHECAKLKANELGLYDMCGNVSEWVWDWFSDGYYYLSDEASSPNPSGPESGEVKCHRGSSWKSDMESMQVFARNEMSPNKKSDKVGFRLCRNSLEVENGELKVE